MSYEIKYKNKWNGKTETHKYSGNESGARGWTENLAKDHNCKAVCEHINDGPYNYNGERKHIVSEGHDN